MLEGHGFSDHHPENSPMLGKIGAKEMNWLYKVHQIRLTDNEIALVNLNGHGYVPKQRAITASYRGVWKPEYRKHYNHVSTIIAPSLEDVYKIGNIGPESSIARHAAMHSISVGDIIEDAWGKEHMVASFGFTEL
jgi:hypothetical protein